MCLCDDALHPDNVGTETFDGEGTPTRRVELITNGIQATDNKGEVKIKVLDDGEEALIKISDTGPGITKETMAKMFEPLFTTKQTGTGLGLSICKTIVEQHGGKIEVSSRPTVFTIHLPKNIRGFYRASDPKQESIS